MADILEALKDEQRRLKQQTETVEAAIALYSGNAGTHRGKRRMSAAARAKIAKAQKARWAKVKKDKPQ